MQIDFHGPGDRHAVYDVRPPFAGWMVRDGATPGERWHYRLMYRVEGNATIVWYVYEHTSHV